MLSLLAHLTHLWKGNVKMEKESEPKVEPEPPKVVQIVRQNGLQVLDFSSQYSSNGSRSYAACNIAGFPSSFPSYGDFVKSFVLRTYGPWWLNAPSAPPKFKRISKSTKITASNDFVDVLFMTPVIPKAIHILETYNPGSVIRILAFQTNNYQDNPAVTNDGGRWVTLWSGPVQICPAVAQNVSPPLQKTTKPMRVIRFEFNHEHLGYYTEIDAVELLGYLVDIEVDIKLHKDEASLNSDITTKLMEQLSINDRVESGGENTELQSSNNGLFDLLPSEVIHLIFLYLELEDILRVAATCRLFFQHCYDPVWYKELDLKPYWSKTNDATLNGLCNRCVNTEKINLSWCGPYCAISSRGFTQFLESSCQRLVCLRLSACTFVDNDTLSCISSCCPQLQELDLSSCMTPTAMGFLHLKVLQNLTRLNLYRVNISDQSLLVILRSTTCLEHLNIGACSQISDCDNILRWLSENCRNLVSLDLWRNTSLTSEGIVRLAEGCPLLEELEIGWCSSVMCSTECVQDFIVTHPRLKKLFMAAIRSTDDSDVLAVAERCPHMEQLDILGTALVGPSAIRRMMVKCPNMKFLDLSFCSQLNNEFVQELRSMYPRTSIKKSFTTGHD